MELTRPVKQHFLTSTSRDLNENELNTPNASNILNDKENDIFGLHTIGFDYTGKTFSILDLPSENNPKIHFVKSSHETADGDDVLQQNTIEVSNLPLLNRFDSCLYDSELNCLFFFINNRNEQRHGLFWCILSSKLYW